MESFSYSVSHHLRASLRGIDGLSPALKEEYTDHLDANARNDLGRIRSGTQCMAMLIDDLLNLARVTRAEMHRETIDLTKMVSDIARAEPNQQIAPKIDGSLAAHGDHRLLPVALQDLLGNARKFTAKRADTRIEFSAFNGNGHRLYCVRDNGAGLDQLYDRIRGYGLGANSFVHEPVEFDRFIEAVRQLGLYRLILNETAPVPRRP